MEVTIDGVIINDAFLEDDTTIEHALKHIQANLCTDDQLVVGVHCDGEDVPAEQMATTMLKPVSSFSCIGVFTGTRASLVKSAMKEASTCLTQTEEACARTATLLTKGSTVEAAETLGECLRVWQQVHEAVGKSIEMLNLNPDQVLVEETSLSTLIGKPKDVLLQMRGALQAQDFVLLADILEYEFNDVTKTWVAIVDLLQQQADEHAQASNG